MTLLEQIEFMLELAERNPRPPCTSPRCTEKVERMAHSSQLVSIFASLAVETQAFIENLTFVLDHEQETADKLCAVTDRAIKVLVESLKQ